MTQEDFSDPARPGSPSRYITPFFLVTSRVTLQPLESTQAWGAWQLSSTMTRIVSQLQPGTTSTQPLNAMVPPMQVNAPSEVIVPQTEKRRKKRSQRLGGTFHIFVTYCRHIWHHSGLHRGHGGIGSGCWNSMGHGGHHGG